jgi:hypothetical protein
VREPLGWEGVAPGKKCREQRGLARAKADIVASEGPAGVCGCPVVGVGEDTPYYRVVHARETISALFPRIRDVRSFTYTLRWFDTVIRPLSRALGSLRSSSKRRKSSRPWVVVLLNLYRNVRQRKPTTPMVMLDARL